VTRIVDGDFEVAAIAEGEIRRSTNIIAPLYMEFEDRRGFMQEKGEGKHGDRRLFDPQKCRKIPGEQDSLSAFAIREAKVEIRDGKLRWH
jgi:hypothetical protein